MNIQFAWHCFSVFLFFCSLLYGECNRPSAISQQFQSQSSDTSNLFLLVSDAEMLMLVYQYYADVNIYKATYKSMTKYSAVSSSGLACPDRHFDDISVANNKCNALKTKHTHVSVLSIPSSTRTDICQTMHLYTDNSYVYNVNMNTISGSFLGMGDTAHDAAGGSSSGVFSGSRGRDQQELHHIDTPHYNLLLYDAAIEQCIEIVLNSDYHSRNQNCVLCIIYHLIMLYKFEIYPHSTEINTKGGKPTGGSSGIHRKHSLEFIAITPLLYETLMVSSLDEFDVLLKDMNIIQ